MAKQEKSNLSTEEAQAVVAYAFPNIEFPEGFSAILQQVLERFDLQEIDHNQEEIPKEWGPVITTALSYLTTIPKELGKIDKQRIRQFMDEALPVDERID